MSLKLLRGILLGAAAVYYAVGGLLIGAAIGDEPGWFAIVGLLSILMAARWHQGAML